MKTLIIYDSLYGNTEVIAKSIWSVFSPEDSVVKHINDVQSEKMNGFDLLIIGSPTQGFNPTKLLKSYINFIPDGSLANIKVASFDTRIGVEYLNTKFMKFMVSTFGYAGSYISRVLVKKGGKKIIEPEGFFVTDMKGPLKDGEVLRAQEWAVKIRELATENVRSRLTG